MPGSTAAGFTSLEPPPPGWTSDKLFGSLDSSVPLTQVLTADLGKQLRGYTCIFLVVLTLVFDAVFEGICILNKQSNFGEVL